MQYVVIDEVVYEIDSDEGMAAAEEALVAAGESSTPVWVCPQAGLAAAEAAGFDGAYENGRTLFAPGAKGSR